MLPVAVIFEAATDGTDQLRYLATADIAPLVKSRRETSEKEYIAFMRARFSPKNKACQDTIFLADCQVGKEFHLAAGHGQLVEGGKRDEDLAADTNVHHRCRASMSLPRKINHGLRGRSSLAAVKFLVWPG